MTVTSSTSVPDLEPTVGAAGVLDWDREFSDFRDWHGSELAARERPDRLEVGRVVRAWLRAHTASIAVIVGLVALVLAVVGTGITHYPSFGDDEGTYTAEAWAFITHGQLSHYTYWYDHPPLAWIVLGILRFLLDGLVHNSLSVSESRSLMLIPASCTVVLMYLLARRIGMRRGFAALGPILLVLSPLGLDGLREVYLENFALPWLLAAFLLALSPRGRLWTFTLSGVCLAAAVLSKETFLLFAPGVALAAFQNSDRRTRVFALTAFGATFVLLVAIYPLYATLKGELLPGKGHVSLWYGITWQLFNRQASGSLFQAGSAARQTLDGWLSLDPWLLAIGVATTLPALLVRRLRAVAVAITVAVLETAHGGYLPVPFEIGLMPLLALMPAGVLDVIWGHGPHGSRPSVFAGRDPLSLLRALCAGLVIVGIAVAVGPSWFHKDKIAMTENVIVPEVQAEQWIRAHIPRTDRVLVDDTMYVDLVHAGFEPRYGVVWFYKLQTDPAVTKRLPEGWRDINYVISTSVLRAGAQAQGLVQVQDALKHSSIVTQFGYGGGAIYIEKVHPGRKRAG